VSTSKQSNKVARTAERKRLRNRLVHRSVRTYIAKAKSSADAGEESAYQKTTLAISSIDKAVSKGIIHRNKGARIKSRLMEKLNKQ
jgi:small subunit ribosomal protein S20